MPGPVQARYHHVLDLAFEDQTISLEMMPLVFYSTYQEGGFSETLICLVIRQEVNDATHDTHEVQLAVWAWA